MKSVMVGLILLLATASLHAQPPIQPRWVKTGHYGGIAGMAFAPEGRYLASMGSRDDRILVWDTKSPLTAPKILHYPVSRDSFQSYFWPHQASAGGIAFTPDGKSVIATADTGIYVWDILSGKITDSITSFTAGAVWLMLSNTGDSVAWLTVPNVIVRYNLRTHVIIDTVGIGVDMSYSWPRLYEFNMSRDLSTIAYVTHGDDSVMVYSYASRTTRTLSQARFPAYPLLSSDGRNLAISGIDSSCVIDLASGRVLHVFPGYFTMTPIEFTGSGDTLIYADSLLVQLNLRTGDSVVLGVWPPSSNAYPLYSHASKSVAQGFTTKLYDGHDVHGSITLTDLVRGSSIEMTGTQGDVEVQWSPIEDVLTEGSGGVLKTIRANDAATVAHAENWAIISYQGLAYSKDGTRIGLFVGYYDEMAGNNFIGYLTANGLTDAGTLCHAPYWRFAGGGQQSYSPVRLLFSPTGTQFLLDHYLVDTLCNYRDSIPHESIWGFAPDGTTLLAGYERELVGIDTKTLRETSLLGMEAMPIRWARFSNDGSAIMVAHTDNTLEFLSFPALTRLHLLGGNSFPIINASLSKNGRYILSSATDSTLRVWDINSESVIYSYPKYSSPLTAVGFSYDQKYVAATDGGTSIIVWDAPSNLSVQGISNETESILLQNSPNPVITQTTITFSLPFSEEIDIRLFDVMGREVSFLSSGRMSAGEHEIRVGPEVVKSLGAGVYYYRLHSDSGTETKRMIIE